MAIKALKARGSSASSIARTLGVTEGAVRYHLRRQAAGAEDERAGKPRKASRWHEAITTWLGSRAGDAVSLAALHAWLVEEHGYTGSERSVQRHVTAAFPPPARRARRRIETPPGAQAQVDWAEFRSVPFADGPHDLFALHMQLSHSRFDAVVWSERKDQLAWLHCHGEALKRIGGVPATVRIDNEKTAIATGAGAWGEVHIAYRRYAEVARFHVDACAPRSPEHKGKVERRIRDQRLAADPRERTWTDLAELQAWTDERMLVSAHRRRCPVTGTSVYQAWQAEVAHLGELPILPEPFDLVATRRVTEDCLVSFEGRRYSVPFRLVGRTVEVRGCAGRVQVLADTALVASHPRHSHELLLLDPAHYEGEPTDEVLPPTPLGRMGRRLAEIAALAPERPEPRLDVDKTREKLARLGLEHVAGLLEDKLTAAARDEVPPYRFLDQLLDDELGSREERRIRTSLRLSGIPPGMTLGNFDYVECPVMWSAGWNPVFHAVLRSWYFT